MLGVDADFKIADIVGFSVAAAISAMLVGVVSAVYFFVVLMGVGFSDQQPPIGSCGVVGLFVALMWLVLMSSPGPFMIRRLKQLAAEVPNGKARVWGLLMGWLVGVMIVGWLGIDAITNLCKPVY